jgi:hypothetical protein
MIYGMGKSLLSYEDAVTEAAMNRLIDERWNEVVQARAEELRKEAESKSV